MFVTKISFEKKRGGFGGVIKIMTINQLFYFISVVSQGSQALAKGNYLSFYQYETNGTQTG